VCPDWTIGNQQKPPATRTGTANGAKRATRFMEFASSLLSRALRRTTMLLLLLLIVLLLAVVPAWPHSRSWGYRPSGVLGAVLLVVVVLVLLGRI
jgi:hypothetical protein